MWAVGFEEAEWSRDGTRLEWAPPELPSREEPFSLGVELVFGSSCDEEAGCGLGLARLECELLPDAEPDGWLAAAAAGGDLKLISLLTEPSSSMTVRVWTWMFPPEVVNVVKLVLEDFLLFEPG